MTIELELLTGRTGDRLAFNDGNGMKTAAAADTEALILIAPVRMTAMDSRKRCSGATGADVSVSSYFVRC